MLVEIKPPQYDVDIALAYATPNNFISKPVYKRNDCFLHRDAAESLGWAIELALVLDLRLKIFDGFRPQEVQEEFWRFRPDPEFLADPKVGSNHSRGVAVDLTLVDKDGVELDMGTAFDEFTSLSHHHNPKVSMLARKNRYILLGIMAAAGWEHNPREWWHYQLPQAHKYPLLNNIHNLANV